MAAIDENQIKIISVSVVQKSSQHFDRSALALLDLDGVRGPSNGLLNITVEPLLHHFHIEVIVIGATCPVINAEDFEGRRLAEMVNHCTGRPAFKRTNFQNFRDPLIRREGQPIGPVLREPIYSKLVLIIHCRYALMANMPHWVRRDSVSP